MPRGVYLRGFFVGSATVLGFAVNELIIASALVVVFVLSFLQCRALY